jgi:hypothetical protein
MRSWVDLFQVAVCDIQEDRKPPLVIFLFFVAEEKGYAGGRPRRSLTRIPSRKSVPK